MKSALSRSLVAASLIVACMGAAIAGPTLTSDPYPLSDAQPNTATVAVTAVTSTGMAPVATIVSCKLPAAVDGSVQPVCDLSSFKPGQYSLVLTVSSLTGCSGGPAAFYCDSGGTASSDPFSLTLRSGGARKPTPHLAP